MPDPQKFQIGYQKTLDHLVLEIAKDLTKMEADRFQKALFDAVLFQSTGQIREHLVLGSISGAFLPIPEAMDLFSKGLDIQLLMLTHRGGGSILIKRKANIRGISDFRGKILLIDSPLSIRHMLLHRLLSSGGLKPGLNGFKTADVSCEVVCAGLMPEIFFQDVDNDIAGLACCEPFAEKILGAETVERLCRTSDLWPNHPCGAFVMRSDTINAAENKVQALIRLFFKAADALTSDKSGKRSQAAKFLDLPENEVLKIRNDSGICFSPDLLVPDKSELETVHHYMSHDMKLLKPKLDLDRLVNPEFIKSNRLETVIED